MHAPRYKCTACGAPYSSRAAAEDCARRDLEDMMKETSHVSKGRPRRGRVTTKRSI